MKPQRRWRATAAWRAPTQDRSPRLIDRLCRARSGAVAIITAVALSILVGAGALVIDIGLAYMRHAQVQASTDMATLTAGWLLPTGNVSVVQTSARNALAQTQYGGTAFNGSPTIGLYTQNTTVAPSARYSAGQQWSCVAQSNADQLQAQAVTPVTLGRGINNQASLSVAALATATRNVDAAFTVASGLLSVSQTSTMNAVLGGLLGTNISLQAVDYSNLLNANVGTLAFLNALATQLHVTSGTYNSVLNSSASVNDIIAAETSVLATQGSTGSAAITSLNTLKTQANLSGAQTFQVGQLLALGTWGTEPLGTSGPPAAVFGQLNVYNLLSFSAQAANGGHALSINQTGVSIPGVATMSLALTAIEPPQPSYYQFATPCSSVHTAQIRVQLNLRLLQLLSIPVIGLSAPINVPIYLEVASGTGTLLSVGCPTSAPGTTTATIQAQSSAFAAYVGNVSPSAMSNFTQTPVPTTATIASGSLLNLSVLTVTGSATVPIAQATNSVTFQFAAPNQQTAAQTQTVSSLGSASNLVGPSLMSNLLLNLQVSVLGIPILPVSAIKTLVVNALTPILTALGPVIDQIIDTALQALGISVANVTIAASGARCGPPILVQ